MDEVINIDISIKDLIEFNPSIGTESCHLFGTMGSGKSNFGYGVILTALLDRDEFAIMPGDVAVEWRHFPMHPEYNLGLTVIVPKDIEIFYYPDELVYMKENSKSFIEVNYENLDVFKYLSNMKPLLVIYDQHLSISDRAKLWARILETVVRRRVHVKRAINFLMHESGIVFPESARGEHWKHVRNFSEIFVETRKMGVRIFFVSQLETELEYTIRRKCNYKIIKKSFLRTEYAKPIRAAAPFLKVNEFILVYGGMYRLDNTFKETIEHKPIWKMIPPVSLISNNLEEKSGVVVNQSGDSPTDRLSERVKNAPIWCYLHEKEGVSMKRLAELYGEKRTTVQYHIDKVRNNA